MRFKRITAVVALSTGLLTSLTACDLWVPQSTLTNGESSDGASGHVGQIYVANAVLIKGDDRANLVVSLVNEGEKTVRLSVSHGTPQATTSVIAIEETVTQIGSPGRQLAIFDDFEAAAGSLYPVFFAYGDETGVLLDVPVLTDAQPMYRDLSPAKVAPR